MVPKVCKFEIFSRIPTWRWSSDILWYSCQVRTESLPELSSLCSRVELKWHDSIRGCFSTKNPWIRDIANTKHVLVICEFETCAVGSFVGSGFSSKLTTEVWWTVASAVTLVYHWIGWRDNLQVKPYGFSNQFSNQIYENLQETSGFSHWKMERFPSIFPLKPPSFHIVQLWESDLERPEQQAQFMWSH